MARQSTQSLILQRVQDIDHALRDEDGVLVRLSVLETELRGMRTLVRWMWGAIGGVAAVWAMVELELWKTVIGGS